MGDLNIRFENPLRMLHLSGGISCLLDSSGLRQLITPVPCTILWTDIRAGQFETAKLKEIDSIRCLFYTDYPDAQAMNANHYNFRLGDGLSAKTHFGLDETQIHRWQGLAVAYERQGMFLRALRAERIAKQIRFCRSTLDTLVKSYRSCLIDKASEQIISRPNEGNVQFTSDAYAIHLAYSLQPCLDALFSFRDYVFTFLFEEMYEKKISLSKLRSTMLEDDRFSLSSLILPLMSNADPYGVIYKTCLYRNVFFHYLGSSGGPISECYCFVETDSPFGKIVRLLFPLDHNISRLQSIERGNVVQYKDVNERNEEAKTFMSLLSHTDALDLCHECFVAILSIARAMETAIPVRSETRQIAQESIIEVSVTENGVKRNFKRGSSGKLEPT